MNSFLQDLKANALVSSLVCIVLGAFLLLRPDLSTSVLCTGAGIVLLLCGGVCIALFLRSREKTVQDISRLLLGIVLAVAGIWLISRPTLLAVTIPRAVGLVICFHGVKNLLDSRLLHQNDYERWGGAAGLGLLTLALGLILVFNPFKTFTTVMRLIGAFLIYDGISDFWINYTVGKVVNHAGPGDPTENAIDVDFREDEG